MLKRIRHRALIIICVIVMCLAVSGFAGTLQYLAARVSSSVYVALHYPAEDLRFDSAEYISVIDEYTVLYKDKEENAALGLWVYPKEFPIFVTYDSVKGEA